MCEEEVHLLTPVLDENESKSSILWAFVLETNEIIYKIQARNVT